MNGIKKFGLATLLLAPMVASQALSFGVQAGITCAALQIGEVNGTGNDAVDTNLPAVTSSNCDPSIGLSAGFGEKFEAVATFTNNANDLTTLPAAGNAYAVTLQPESTVSIGLNYLLSNSISFGFTGDFAKLGLKKGDPEAEEYTNTYGISANYSAPLFSKVHANIGMSYTQGEIDGKAGTAFDNNKPTKKYKLSVTLGYNSGNGFIIAGTTDEDEKDEGGKTGLSTSFSF